MPQPVIAVSDATRTALSDSRALFRRKRAQATGAIDVPERQDSIDWDKVLMAIPLGKAKGVKVAAKRFLEAADAAEANTALRMVPEEALTTLHGHLLHLQESLSGAVRMGKKPSETFVKRLGDKIHALGTYLQEELVTGKAGAGLTDDALMQSQRTMRPTKAVDVDERLNPFVERYKKALSGAKDMKPVAAEWQRTPAAEAKDASRRLRMKREP